MSILNNTCKKCGTKFHYSTKCCGYNAYYDDRAYLTYGYCSEPCYLLHSEFKDDIMKALGDPEYLSYYMHEAIERYKDDGDIDIFLHCIKPIIESRGQ